MFSSIFVRKGKQKLQKRVLEINVHLPNLCLQKIIGFIENKNINESCLGKKRLHRSNNNKAVFAKNLMDYVNRVDWDVFPYDPNVDDDESLSNTIEDTDSDVKSTLKTFRKNDINKIIFPHLNII